VQLKTHPIHQQYTIISALNNSLHQQSRHTYMQTGKLNKKVGKFDAHSLPTRSL